MTSECGCETLETCYDCGVEYDACDDHNCPGPYETESEGYCAACLAYYETTGESDPCDFGDQGIVNPTCAYADKELEPDEKVTAHHFSVRHLPSVAPKEVTSTHERSVAKELGLDPYLDLSQACADFYILERLYVDSHDLASRYDVEAGKTRMDLRLPMDNGRDTRAERLAIAIARTRESLNRELSRQLLTYMVMAVGGELRHASSQAWRVKLTRGTPKRLWPRSPRHRGWAEFPIYASYYRSGERLSKKDTSKLGLDTVSCAACVEHVRAVDTHQKDSIVPCNRKVWYASPKGNEKYRVLPSTHANPNCPSFEWWCTTHNIIPTKETRIPWKPETERLRNYSGVILGSEHRGLAWREWLKTYTTYGVPLLRDCEDVFRKWKWSNSYGGRTWATATHIAAEVASGKMREDAFLDRVWTLQHNGGNLFNKFYRHGLDRLATVLDTQAEDKEDYSKLIKYASRYTQELWREAKSLGVFDRTPAIIWG